MKKEILVLVLISITLVTLNGQFAILPKSGEGRMARSDAAVFLQEPQFLKPSIFWSPKKVDLQLNRKWWRNPPNLPELKNNGLERIIVSDGQPIWVEPMIKGFISLYREPVVPQNSMLTNNTSWSTNHEDGEPSCRYWIGRQQFSLITNMNYKQVVRSIFSEANDLHEKLGNRGFRFENLPSMVIYYNSYFAQQPLQINRLSREDLILR